MSKSFNVPRLGLGFSEEQRAALQRANRLKQELYAQQKKIQFSNLLERSGRDVESYVESQNNVFISSGRADDEVGDSDVPSVKEHSPVVDKAMNEATSPSFDSVDASDDRDGVDFFLDHAFRSKTDGFSGRPASMDDIVAFDPVAPESETLREHLTSQLRLDGKFSNLDAQLRRKCLKIVDALDVNGYLKVDAPSFLPEVLPHNSIAYPEEDVHSLLAVEEFDLAFDIDSTREQRIRAKKALDVYFSSQSTRESRISARAEFDAIVGRQTTRDEREKARKILDAIAVPQIESDPLKALFSSEERPQAEEALRIVQTLDPPGVGARDLRESMLLRLRPDAKYAEQLRRLISNYFDDFIKKHLGALAKKSGISQDELMKIYAAPFPFYPSPGELFTSVTTPTRTIFPEIIVEADKRGRWIARLDETLTNVELDPYYQKMLLSKRVDRNTRNYLRRQYVEAQALMDALRNRNSTLLRVAKAVVDFQEKFFSEPTSTPKPLTQQQIADKLGLDTSTVSRACNDKWLSTPRGYVPFKDFFPKAVTGEVTSSNVADKIRAIVDQESSDSPLSDEEIAAELMKQFNVKVSRKTVQEHRDQLQIPNSRIRKRIKSAPK